MRSMKTKVTAMLLFITVVMGLGIGFFGIRQASVSLKSNIRDEMMILSEQVSHTVEKSLKADYSFLQALAKHPMVCDTEADPVKQKEFLLSIAKERGVKDIGVASAEGRTLTDDMKTYADVAERPYYTEAMKGKCFASDPFEDSTKPGVMIMMMSVPVYDGDEVVGVLYQLGDGAYLSQITNEVKFGETGAAYMINNKGTNIAHPDESKVIEQENAIEMFANDPAFAGLIRTLNKILEGGSGYDEYTYEGVSKCVGYSEVEGTDWHVVVFAGHDELYSGIRAVRNTIFYITIPAVILFSLAGYFIIRRMLSPIKAVEGELGRISGGDFSRDIPQKLLKAKDEMGTLANALNKMQSDLSATISKVNEKSQQVNQFADDQGKRIHVLMENVESVSATSEQIAASSEQGAASAEQMTGAANEARHAVENIAMRAQEGARTSVAISERAEKLQEDSIRSKENATTMCRESITVLERAIEDSKKVERINQLSNAILEISSQTNLLALNASIEAARAGEAGKGFAVVATEIGKLADDSQHSVSQIMEVTHEVIDSVEHLSDCAKDILSFLQETVMADYENMVKTGSQYNEDAQSINGMVSDMSATTEELLATITTMVESLEQISTASGESATGTTVIAQSNAEIVQHTGEISDLAARTNEATQELAEAVSVFKLKD